MEGSPTLDRATRWRMLAIIAVSLPLAFLAWVLLREGLPPIAGGADPAARLGFGFGCVGLAALLGLVPGVEAIAHERLLSPAIDPLAGYETQRLRINQRYLSNTLEQFVVFAAGILLLCTLPGESDPLRAAAVTTIVWILSRWAFWIGYHVSPLHRGWGAFGMIQSIIVLGYGVYVWGSFWLGPVGGLAPLAIFAIIEAWLLLVLIRR